MLIPVSITSHSVEKGKQISAGSADKYFDPCGSHLVDVQYHSIERALKGRIFS